MKPTTKQSSISWMFDPKPGDWLQFFGALIAAGTGVALWFAERHRISSNIRYEEAHRTHEFRAVVCLALTDLENQIHPIVVLGETTASNYEDANSPNSGARGSNKAASEEVLKELRLSASQIRISPAPILELSTAHARHLSVEQSSAASLIYGGARKIGHLIDQLARPTASIPDAIDALNVVVQASVGLLGRIDSLKAQLGVGPYGLSESSTRRKRGTDVPSR